MKLAAGDLYAGRSALASRFIAEDGKSPYPDME
jgi:hypothetical protein